MKLQFIFFNLYFISTLKLKKILSNEKKNNISIN